jgi:hypothetical protein
MTKRIYLVVLFFVTAIVASNAQQRKETKKTVTQKSEMSVEKEIIINPEALKSINLGSPRMSSSSSNMKSTDVKDLTNEILGKKESLDAPHEGKLMLGFSCFASAYENRRSGQKLKVDPMGFGEFKMPPRGGMQISKDATTPRYLAADKIKTMFGPSAGVALSFSAEDILESIFWRKPPDLWTHYADKPKPNFSIETDMPDDLIKIRQANVAMMDSLINTSSKKYKIVYLFCDESDYSTENFPEVVKYVENHKDKFDLFPVSGKKHEDLSCIAKYLHKVAYYSPVYVLNGNHKESLILMLDQNHKAISLLACDTRVSKKFDEIKLLP